MLYKESSFPLISSSFTVKKVIDLQQLYVDYPFSFIFYFLDLTSGLHLVYIIAIVKIAYLCVIFAKIINAAFFQAVDDGETDVENVINMIEELFLLVTPNDMYSSSLISKYSPTKCLGMRLV